jgi:hypothetical protein
MTHDEFIDYINNSTDGLKHKDIFPLLLANTQALRAVVELHKPYLYDGRMGKYERCSGCSSEEEWLGNIYPCPTIQAIEKELV